MPVQYNITADSRPDYDDWGPDNYWSCLDWITWHKAMKAKYGQERANQVFVQYYGEAGFGAASYDCRTFNSDFREYARDNGFLDQLYGGIGVIMQPFGWAIETGGNLVENIGGAAVGTTKVLRILIPVAAIAIIGGALYWGYTKYIKK